MGTSPSKHSCVCGQTRDHAEGAAECLPTAVASDSRPALLELREEPANKESQPKNVDPEDLHTSEVSTAASSDARQLEDVETASMPGICQDALAHDTSPAQNQAMTASAAAEALTVQNAPLQDAPSQGAPFSQEPTKTEPDKDASPRLESLPAADVVAEPPKPVKPKRTEAEKAKRRAEKEVAKAEKEAAKAKEALYKKKSYLQRHREEKAEYEKNKEKNMKLVDDIMAGKYKTAGGGQPQGNMRINMPTPADRINTRDLMLGKFRAQYAKIGRQPGQECPSALSQEALSYTPAETSALTIVGGHQNMPRPQGVNLPADFRKPWPGGKLKEKRPEDRLATMTLKQLAEFGCDSDRKLCSVYGDIFDVSDRPDKYGSEGPYYWMAGVDITWGFVSGKDVPETVNKCYDLWKVAPETFRESKLRTIYAWVGFYEWEYGQPIAKLDQYAQENALKGPPMEESEDCCIM